MKLESCCIAIKSWRQIVQKVPMYNLMCPKNYFLQQHADFVTIISHKYSENQKSAELERFTFHV